MKQFISSSFNIEAFVEKLESKGTNASFKIGVNFDQKDEILNSSAWPKNTLIKRFLFKRTNNRPAQ